MLQQDRLARLRAEITEISPGEAAARCAAGATLLDIRDPEELALGSPTGALRIGRSFLELEIEAAAPDADTKLMILCGSGVRSLFAADGLKRLGYRSVVSVAGGFRAWSALG